MPYPYTIHELAYKEYIKAYSWYESRLPGLGGRFMDCVEKRLWQISEHPEHCQKTHGHFKEAKVEDFPYMIVYEFFENGQFIHVASIYHCKRNPKRRYRRMK